MCTQSKCECRTEAAKSHVHAASMKLYAEDAAETDKPWEWWEVLAVGHQFWNTCVEGLYWHPSNSYRRKRKMRVVNGFSVPAPETEVAEGARVFCSHMTTDAWVSSMTYSQYNKVLLERGLIFLNKDDAIANAKAMCGIDPSS